MWSKLLIITTISNHAGQPIIPEKKKCFITFSFMHDMVILVVEFRGYKGSVSKDSLIHFEMK